MRSSWRRSTALILALTVAMLLGLAGLASAEVSQVTVTSPTSDARVYAKIGTVVRVTATVTTTSETGKVWMKTGVGNCVSNIDYVEVGTGSGSYYCDVKIIAGATEGWVNVSAQAYQEDVPGGSGTPKAHAQTSAVFVDIEAPSVPGAFATNPTSPGNDDTPTWSWAGSTDQGTSQSGMDHYKVQIASSTTSDTVGFGTWADAAPATVPHPGSGDPSWTADPALTAGGWYKIRVCAVDKAGNESAYTGDSGVYQFDNKAPTLPGAATVDPASPSKTDDTPVWTWDESLDNEPNEAWQTGLHGTYAYKLEHTQNGSVVSTYDLLSPEWKPTVTEGLHRVRVKAFDKVDNETSWVQGADYCFDTTAPIMGAFNNPTSPGTNKKPRWTWTASDGQYGSGIPTADGYTVQVSTDGGSSWGTTDPGIVSTPSWIPDSELGDGTYVIRVMVADNATNTSGWSLSGTYTLDTSPPGDVASITVPSPNPGNVKRPNWSWPAADALGGTPIASYDVQLSTNGADYQAASPASVTGGVTAWTPNYDMSDGEYWIRVKAVDQAGNKSGNWRAAAAPYQLDATKPVIDTNSWDPVNDSWIGSSTYTVEVDITDPMGDGGTYSSGLNTGAGSLAIDLSPAATVGAVSWSGDTLQIPLSNLADLTEYTLKVDIKDKAGNPAVQGVLIFHVDLSGPTFTEESPIDGLETNDVDIRPHITIEDDGSGVNDGSIVWTVTDPDTAPVSGEWTWAGPPASGVSTFVPGTVDVPVPLSTEGYYKLTVYAEDTTGHGSTYQVLPEVWTFLLDTAGPEVDIELNAYRDINSQIYTPRNGAAGRELVLTVTATDPGASPSGFNVSGTLTVEVYDNEAKTGMPIPGSTTLNPNPRPSANTDPWTATWTPTGLLPDGKYYVRVIATDDAGNGITDDTFTFIVDTQAPDIADNAAEVGFLNTSNSKRFTNSREIEVTWGKTLDPLAGDEPGSGLLGYKFEIHAKEENTPYNAANKLCDDYSDTDNVPELGVPVAYLKPTVGDTELWTAGPLAFATGKSYGAWIKAIDKVHNTSDWFDPPFIFDIDEPTAPQDAEIRGLKNALSDRRTNDSTPTLEWKHSTDIQAWAQSGVDLYEVQIDRAGTGTWDIRYVVDIEDEDVDKVGPDDPLDPSGDPFEWTVPSKLEDGGYEVRVRAKDVAGNYSDWEFTEAFFIDTTPPPVPGIPTATSPTKNQKPSWTWTLSPGAFGYNVYLDGEATPSAFVAEPTPPPMLFVHSTTLTEGVHHLQVTAVDDLGNESVKSGTGHVVIDLTKPDAPVMFGLKPFINGNWDDSVTLIWTAREDAVEYEVAYKIGATPDTKKVAVQTCVLVLGTLPIPEGTVIEATVSARDAAGNWSDPSNKVSTTVDSQKPTVTQEAPIPSGRMKLTPTWTWSAQDGTGSQVSHYIVLLNGELLLETTSTSFKPASELDTGEYTLTVVAVDNVGNQSDPNQGKFPTVTIDRQAPAAPGMPVTTSPTNSQTPTWTWKHISDADLEKYNVYLDGSLKGSVVGPWSLGTTSIEWPTPENLGHGLHVLEVTSVDDLGNESAKSTQGHVMVDLVAPDVPTMNPMPAFSKQGSITFSWSASTDDLAVKYNFQYSTDNKATWNTRSGLTSQSAIVDANGLADGTKVYGRVMAYDAVLNDDGYSDDVYTTIDAVAPVVAPVTTPPARDNNATPTWEWSVTETGSGLDYFVAALDSELPFRTTGTSFTPSSKLVDDEHELIVYGVDKAGNVGTSYTFPKVTIDTTPPATPEMPVTTSPTNSQTPTWTWKHISDADLEKYNVYLDGSLKGSVVGPWLLGTTSITWLTPEDLGHGLHVLEVTSVDDLGNESAKSTQGHVLVDLRAPEVPEMDPIAAWSKPGSIRFAWSVSHDDLAVKYNFQHSTDGNTWTTVSGLTAQSAIVDASELADGTRVYGRAMAYDAVNNESTYSNPVSTMIDGTGPVVTITKPTETVTTNAATFKYEWTAVDAGCGVASYTVEFNGSKHQVDETSTDNKYWYEATLKDGNNTFKVFATDKLGNVDEAKVAPVVKQVKPQIILVQPMQGANYRINEISTIAFQVIGLYDAVPQVLLNGEPLEPWRIVTVVNTPTMAKFYILLDGDVMVPGQMGIRITVGAGSELFSYTVSSERSGFGFGRLRPW